MRKTSRVFACALLVLTAILTSGCNEGGIGMGVPTSGARWSGGGGPDVFVAGGPVYR